MTKAERIYNATYNECKIHLVYFGKHTGLDKLMTNEAVSTRTLNDVKRIIDREYERMERRKCMGQGNREVIESMLEVIGMVQSTLDNHRVLLRRR